MVISPGNVPGKMPGKILTRQKYYQNQEFDTQNGGARGPGPPQPHFGGIFGAKSGIFASQKVCQAILLNF